MTGRHMLIINQVGVPKRPEIAPADFAKALGVTPLAVIPHDPQSFGLAQGNGQMLFEVAPKSKATEILGSSATHRRGSTACRRPKQKAAGSSLLSKFSVPEEKVIRTTRTPDVRQKSQKTATPHSAASSSAAALRQRLLRHRRAFVPDIAGVSRTAQPLPHLPRHQPPEHAAL